MSLNVAIQMDPIERVRIAGDTGFALMLEAQARGHTLYTYTPEPTTLTLLGLGALGLLRRRRARS